MITKKLVLWCLKNVMYTSQPNHYNTSASYPNCTNQPQAFPSGVNPVYHAVRNTIKTKEQLVQSLARDNAHELTCGLA